MPAKRVKKLCSVCSLPQRETKHGLVCSNGHGGADSLEAKPAVTSGVRRRARHLVVQAIRNITHTQPDVLMRAALQAIADQVLRGKPKEGRCCQWEDRDMNGGCRNCGDPCL